MKTHVYAIFTYAYYLDGVCKDEIHLFDTKLLAETALNNLKNNCDLDDYLEIVKIEINK
jgi:hypothetical protein